MSRYSFVEIFVEDPLERKKNATQENNFASTPVEKSKTEFFERHRRQGANNNIQEDGRSSEFSNLMVRVEALSKRIKALIKDTERTKAGNGSDQKYESAQMQSEKIKEILERYSGGDITIDTSNEETIPNNEFLGCKSIDHLQEKGNSRSTISSNSPGTKNNTNTSYKFKNIVNIKIIGTKKH